MERLDKFLCDSGVGTRSQVKAILKSGAVAVDGGAVRDGSVKIDPQTAQVCFQGRRLGGWQRVVLMLNKPAGFVTATEDRQEKTVMELLPEQYRHLDVKPVGRLDKATEGLLLLTPGTREPQRTRMWRPSGRDLPCGTGCNACRPGWNRWGRGRV